MQVNKLFGIQKGTSMGEPSGWQVAGTAPEMLERYIIPAFINLLSVLR
jgi:hypothetical protein